MKTLVLLVSEQTIPNYLFIRTFGPADHYVFITTQKMEDPVKGNRREWIMKAAGINAKQTTTIQVNPEFRDEILRELHAHPWNKYGELNVNLTGGTKMMAIAAWDFFRNVTPYIWYIPVNAMEYHQCNDSSIKKPLKYSLTAKEYLACCGILEEENRFNSGSCMHSFETASNFMAGFFKQSGKSKLIDDLRRNYRGKNSANIPEEILQEYKKILQEQFSYPVEEKISNKDVDYITGGWFEEYCYYQLKGLIENPETNLMINVHLTPGKSGHEKAAYFSQNELDVLLVHQNNLYIVECKTEGMGKNTDEKNLFNETLYKAAALRKYFLLTVRSVLCTLDEMNENKREKAIVFDISLIERKDFESGNSLKRWKEILGIK